MSSAGTPELTSFSLGENARTQFLAACLAVGLIMGGLLIGYEPVGGDPDRMYRPIKAELASSLRQGTLPFWSDKLGLGVPLVAESHVAAFYPLNWLFYGALSVSLAYRLSMWLHYVALGAAVFAYARQMRVTPWGAAISAVAFTFCGFQTIHSCHECFYHTLPYLPLCLLAADKFASTGRLNWLGTLGLLWGVQITLGHFQLQMWTGGLSLIVGGWRVAQERRPLRRIFGLVVALILGLGVAMVQLAPSFELAQMGGQLKRSFGELAFYSYPPDHWNELAVPGLFRKLAGGPEDRYWFSQRTTGSAACLFVGTIPLILALVEFIPDSATNGFWFYTDTRDRQCLTWDRGKNISGWRGVCPWRVITILTLALATMPRWWPMGYACLLQVPGFGFFRCPARYTMITSLGLCLLAGRGFDRAIGDKRFRAGLSVAGLYAACSFVWAFALPRIRPEFRPNLDDTAIAIRVGIACVTWIAAMIMLISWRRNTSRAWMLFAITTVEVGAFYQFAGTTRWGWPVRLPEASNVLNFLTKAPGAGRIGGPLDNLPLRAGLITGDPYTGFSLPIPNNILKSLDASNPASIARTRWLRRFGVTHLVLDKPLAASTVEEIFHGDDFVLDELALQKPGNLNGRDWRVFRIRDIFPPVRLGFRIHDVPELRSLIEVLSLRDGIDEAWYMSADAPPRSMFPRAESARIVKWDGLAGAVEHSGAVELILCRAHYPGWEVTINNQPPRPALRSNGGLLTARLDGTGTSQVSFRYRPRGMNIAVLVSAVAILLCLGFMVTRPVQIFCAAEVGSHDRFPEQSGAVIPP
jgi:hypothetical protein